MSERRDTTAEEHDTWGRLDALARYLPVGVFLTSLDGEPRYVSQRCSEIIGTVGSEDRRGAWLDRVHPEDHDRVVLAWAACRSGTSVDERYRVVDDDGSCRWLHVRADPIREPGGDATIIGIVEDTTDLVDLQRRSGARELMLDAVLNNSSDLVVVIDQEARLTFVNEAARRVLGRSPNHWVGRDVFELLHPDDVGLTISALATSMEHGTEAMAPVVLRVRHADQSWRQVEVIANSLEGNQHVGGMVITARDITGRLRAEARAVAARDRFEQAFDRAPIGMALVANDGRLVRANDALAHMVGRRRDDLTGVSLFAFTHPEDRDDAIERALAVLDRDDDDPIEVRFVRRDGHPAWARITSTVIRDDAGAPQHTIAHIEDVTEQRTAREQLERAAAHDSLTGLLNRAGFAHRFTEISETNSGRPGALLIIDLDGFKAVNDAYGHAAGDDLLGLIAQRLVDSVRVTDLVGRLGGDEFAIYQPDVIDASMVVALGERVRASLAAPFALGDDRQMRISGSIGVALLDGRVPLPRALATADAASYAAKRSGGDRVELTWCTELGVMGTER